MLFSMLFSLGCSLGCFLHAFLQLPIISKQFEALFKPFQVHCSPFCVRPVQRNKRIRTKEFVNKPLLCRSSIISLRISAVSLDGLRKLAGFVYFTIWKVQWWAMESEAPLDLKKLELDAWTRNFNKMLKLEPRTSSGDRSSEEEPFQSTQFGSSADHLQSIGTYSKGAFSIARYPIHLPNLCGERANLAANYPVCAVNFTG